MIVLIDESGSGKSTIEKELENLGYKRIISYTTRQPRANEINGVHYNFIDKDTFKELMNQCFFAEVVYYNDNFYGTAFRDCVDDSVIVVELSGLIQLKQKPELKVKAFYLKADDIVRYNRMIQQGRPRIEVLKRLYYDAQAFKNVENYVDVVVDANGTVDETLKQILEELK